MSLFFNAPLPFISGVSLSSTATTMTLINSEVVGKVTASTSATFNLVDECGFSMNSGDVIVILGFVDDGGSPTLNFSAAPSWLTEICGNHSSDEYADSRPVLYAGICNGTDELADQTFTLSASDKAQFFCWHFRSSNAAISVAAGANIFNPTTNIDMAGTYSVSPAITGGSPTSGKQRIGMFFVAGKPDGANEDITPITTSPSGSFTNVGFTGSVTTNAGGTASNFGQSWYNVMTSSDTLGSETLASSDTTKGTMLYFEVDVRFSGSVFDDAFMYFDADDWDGTAGASIANRGTDGTRYTLHPDSGIALGTNAGGNYFDAQTIGDTMFVKVNGNDDIPNGDKLHLPGAFTMMVALKIDSTNHSGRIVDKSIDSFSARGWSIRRNATDAHYDIFVNDTATLTDAAERQTNNTAWAWSGAHEIWAMTMDTSGNYVHYENDTAVVSATDTAIRADFQNHTETGIEMAFFNWPHVSSGNRATLGRIYAAAFWDRVLSSSEMTEAYNKYSSRMV